LIGLLEKSSEEEANRLIDKMAEQYKV